MSLRKDEGLRAYWGSQGVTVPNDFKFPVCDHPIEKWCSNCDYDCDTYERIPHTRKYPQIYFLDDE